MNEIEGVSHPSRVSNIKNLIKGIELDNSYEYVKTIEHISYLISYKENYEDSKDKFMEAKYNPMSNGRIGREFCDFSIHTESLIETVIDLIILQSNNLSHTDYNQNNKRGSYGKKTKDLVCCDELADGTYENTKYIADIKNKFAHEPSSHSIKIGCYRLDDQMKYGLDKVEEMWNDANIFVESLYGSNINKVCEIFLGDEKLKHPKNFESVEQLFTSLMFNRYNRSTRTALLEEIKNRGYEPIDKEFKWSKHTGYYVGIGDICDGINVKPRPDISDRDKFRVDYTINYKDVQDSISEILGSQKPSKELGYYIYIRGNNMLPKTPNQSPFGSIDTKCFDSDINDHIYTDLSESSGMGQICYLVVIDKDFEVGVYNKEQIDVILCDNP